MATPSGRNVTSFLCYRYLLRIILLLSCHHWPATVRAFLSRYKACSTLTARHLTHDITLIMSRKRAAPESDLSLSDVIDKKSILYQWASHDDASYHDFLPKEAAEIREALLSWYRANRRKLPWRGDPPPYDGSTAGVNSNKTKKQKSDKANTHSGDEALPVSAYGVWVSEIMLQQTRVEAVIPYYLKWMKRFPTVYALAEASEEEVNSHWAGLGFYRRARLLHKGAKKVVDKYNGELPQTVDELREIDGIGRYTASAIASIAFNVTVPVVDGNVCRVLSRLRGIANHIKAPILKDNLGWKLAEQIISAGDASHAGEVNQALMELGATFCAPSGTGVDDRDPLKKLYMSPKISMAFVQEQKRLADAYISFPTQEYLEQLPASRQSGCSLCDSEGVRTVLNDLSAAMENLEGPDAPVEHIGHTVFPLAPPKKAKREEVLAVAALSFSTNSVERWLLVRRPSNGLLAGQWEFPSVCVWTSESSKSRKKTKDIAVQVPTIEAPERVEALNTLLEGLSSSSDREPTHEWLTECSRIEVGDKPIEHVFSHVRHTIWIEHGDGSKLVDASSPTEWYSTEGNQLRWMSESNMKEIGVTAGVKKILMAVKLQRKLERSAKGGRATN